MNGTTLKRVELSCPGEWGVSPFGGLYLKTSVTMATQVVASLYAYPEPDFARSGRFHLEGGIALTPPLLGVATR